MLHTIQVISMNHIIFCPTAAFIPIITVIWTPKSKQPYFLSGKYLEKHTKYGMPCASEHSGTGRFFKISFYISRKQCNYINNNI